MSTWRPPEGTTTLVEPLRPEPGFETLTATVLHDERLLLDLGASPRPTENIDVVASFFTPDALLRVSGVLVAEADGLYELVVKDIERVQRRTCDRAYVQLTASVLVLDGSGPMISVVGHTKNVSTGGCRLRTDQPLPSGRDAMVSLDLTDDRTPVVAQATVLGVEHTDDEWDYRLMFTAIDDDDRARIGRLLAA